MVGFEDHARKMNESAMGKRNGGSMVSAQGSERALLAFLLSKLQELDADVYTGHNISGFDIDVLLHRLQAHKVTQFHSRMSIYQEPSLLFLCKPDVPLYTVLN